MSTFQRFVVLLALCLLAVLVPTATYTQKAWAEAATAQLEDQGIAPSRALLQVIKFTQQHRGLSAVWLGGKPEVAQARQAKAAEVQAAVARYTQAMEAAGGLAGPVGAKWKESLAAWQALLAQVEGQQVDGARSSALHTAAIGQMIGTLQAGLDQWGMIFDPQPDTYFMVIGALQEAPQMIEFTGQLRARGANLLSAASPPPPADRARYAGLVDRMDETFKRVRHNLQRAADTNEAEAAKLKKTVQDLDDLGQRTVAYVRQHVVQPDVLQQPSTEFFAEMTRNIDGMYAALDHTLEVLDHALEARVAETRRALALMAVLVLLLMAAAIGFAAHTGRWVWRSLGSEPDDLRRIAARVAEGDFSAHLNVRDGDERSVLAAMQRMQSSLAGVVGSVRANAERVAVASQEIAQGNQDLSARTESQASTLEQTAAAMEELRTTIARAPKALPRPAPWPRAPARSPAAAVPPFKAWPQACRKSSRVRAALPTSSAPSTASPSRPTSWR